VTVVDPYPPFAGVPIVDFVYETPLWLARGIEAVKARSGEDADYVVGQPYTIRYRRKGEGWRRVTVPMGLITDLASVPRFIRPLIDRVGPHLEASIVHDYLYVAWQDLPHGMARPQDRTFADALFLAGMKAARVPAWKRWTIYMAVHLFGGRVYRDRNPGRYMPTPTLLAMAAEVRRVAPLPSESPQPTAGGGRAVDAAQTASRTSHDHHRPNNGRPATPAGAGE
jgi:hypothetical protein